MNVLENEGTSYIDQPGQYAVTITEATPGYDNNSDETVSVVYTADNESTIKCRYTNNKSWGWKPAISLPPARTPKSVNPVASLRHSVESELSNARAT